MGVVDCKPLISVIVPVYKVEPYLHTCIDSILAQTYTNLEIILVDDGSPDNCPAICDEYAQKDARVKVIHKENGGISSARNAGLDICIGEYVTFVDSDDTITPDWIYHLYSGLNDRNVDFVIGGVTYVQNAEERYNIPSSDQLTVLVKCSLFGYSWNKLYRTKSIDHMRFINIPREDIIFNLSLISTGKKYAIVPISGYNYYQRQDSALHSMFLPDIVCVLDYEANLLQNTEQISGADGVDVYNDVIYSFMADYVYKMLRSCQLRKAEKMQHLQTIINHSSLNEHLKYKYADNTLYRILFWGTKMKSKEIIYYGYRICQIISKKYQ